MDALQGCELGFQTISGPTSDSMAAVEEKLVK